MASRLRAWLLKKMNSRGRNRPRHTTSAVPNPHSAPSAREIDPPPPYHKLDLLAEGIRQPSRTTERAEDTETLRVRNSRPRAPYANSRPLTPPRHMKTSIETARAAGETAVTGMVRALDEQDPKMVAARTAQAIAVAVSTSRSYTAFIAAVTAVESTARLLAEDSRDNMPLSWYKERAKNSIRTATDTAMAADAGLTFIGPWPFNHHDNRSSRFPSRTTHQCPTCSYVPSTG
ncbi:hypothetical protein J7T55_002064 [Diaporthe amygdali]|uniref:uncharacterized protein n=1 Tax=Phomopsis amygdali TaxID=1214568 RepID=UPI0022FDDE6A|nr:uncharacterized protein J7T55_002064 [Diaporthe amygdali]KAJ0108460.1 hypothetical protein J7T55_002064 [Diaporthe amygdali]